MNRLASLFRALPDCERGDVLMEYVIVTCAIVFPLVGVAHATFNPSGDPSLFSPGSAYAGDFGFFGNTFVDWYLRVIYGIALPTP